MLLLIYLYVYAILIILELGIYYSICSLPILTKPKYYELEE